jgi:hypothetical protein
MTFAQVNTKPMSSLSQKTVALATGWRRAISAEDKRQIDTLMGVAILDAEVHRRLIDERDELLFDDFQLSEHAKQILREASANTLPDLAQAVVSYLQSLQPSGEY